MKTHFSYAPVSLLEFRDFFTSQQSLVQSTRGSAHYGHQIYFPKCYQKSPFRQSFSSSFPIYSPLISFSSLITMTRTSKTIPNKIGMDILVLFLILEEILSFFIIENDVLCGFVIYCLYSVEVCSFYAHFLERFFFIINGW